ncbi:MAG: TetR/AcrR family transcriptional regulator [Myxococcota bacterium]|nr:TetR/AcrR family transcriptional regulator [Myxococcota bacterium]MDP7076514.1 TetR/AcrR family transcriptional regulator [Myxococcota bacterium]MDP7432925.1 TetR/AcrR family transcriptional regulator [Myxococcota bacterium]
MPQDASEAPLNRRDRRRLEIYERIVEAGEALFEEQGYDETKVAEICERADVAYGTFFNHFPTKLDLLREMADRALVRMVERLEELSKQRGNIEDLLILLFEGGAQTFQELSPGRRELVGRVQTLAYTDSPEDRDRRFHAAFQAFLRRAVEEGRVRDDVPVETLAEVVSSSFAFMSLSWLHFDDYPVRERAASAARFLASTLAPKGERK